MNRQAPVHLLAVQFFRRFFDNDLVSPNGDGHEHLATLLAIVAAPGLLASVFLLLRYTSPLLSPGERLLTALPHKFLLLGCSVCVMALVACVEWDALSLDARDHAILGPLPLAPRTILVAKLTALSAFAGLFAAATNVIPAFFFPMVFLGTVPIGLGRGMWVVIAHAAVSVIASLFGFVAVLALRETVRIVVGRRLFRLVSAPLQFGAVLALASALLILPALPSRTTTAWIENPEVARWMPPSWFVGLEETVTANVILDAPGISVPSAGRFWTAGRDRRARAAYRANTPLFQALARIAVAGTLTSTALGFIVFLIGVRRRDTEVAGVAGANSAGLQAFVTRILARHPQRQAGLGFTLRTLARSPQHRLHFAAYLAAGAASALVLVGPSLLHHVPASNGSIPPRLYAVQMILTFFVVAGLKAVFARPAALPANWLFQLCWTNDVRRYRSGVRRASAVVLAAFLLLLAPLHLMWLDWRTAVLHFLVGWLAALAAAELAGIQKGLIPFTCATVPSGSLKKWWPAYLLAFVSYTFGIGAIERHAFRSAQGAAALIGALVGGLVLVIAARNRVSGRNQPVTYEEEPDLTQELGLGNT